MSDSYNISYDKFIRTTSEEHKLAVTSFWSRLNENNFITQGSYAGYYSVNDEAFISETDLLKA